MSNQISLDGYVAKNSITRQHNQNVGEILEFRVREKCWNKRLGNYTTFWRIKMFGTAATNVSKYLTDGAFVVVHGRIAQYKVTVPNRDTGGDKELTVTEIIAHNVSVPRISDSSGPAEKQSRDEIISAPRDDDDMPF